MITRWYYSYDTKKWSLPNISPRCLAGFRCRKKEPSRVKQNLIDKNEKKQRLDEKFKNAEIDRDRWKWIGLTDRRNSEKKTFRVFKSFSSVGGKIQIFVTSMSNRTSNVCSINRENRKIRKIITSHFFPDSIFLSFWKKKKVPLFFEIFRVSEFQGRRRMRSVSGSPSEGKNDKTEKIEWTPFWHKKIANQFFWKTGLWWNPFSENCNGTPSTVNRLLNGVTYTGWRRTRMS